MQSLHALASKPGFIWLDSADPDSPASQRSIVGTNPVATWSSSVNGYECTGAIVTDTLSGFIHHGEKMGTLLGYFSYEAASQFGRPQFKGVSFHHHETIPDVWLGVYPTVDILSPFAVTSNGKYTLEPTSQAYDKAWFLEQIANIQSHIRNGDIYQANLTRPFTCKFSGDPLDLYCQFREMNPAPYGAYLNIGSTQIMCTSPEQFFKISGRTIQSRPIKGTMTRETTPGTDDGQKLLESEKNRAELTMIVDLIRNDLGKICEPGSVKVPETARVETYKQLHHLVATVSGTLNHAVSLVDVLNALLPGGSITGAPKARAMEIISQTEAIPRSVYTGAIGYHNLSGESEFNLAIRTAYHVNGIVTYHAGCGIVADSDPESEWVESQTKSLGFYDCLTKPNLTTLN